MGGGRAGRPARCRVIAVSGAVRRRLLRRLRTAAPGRPRRLPGEGPRGLVDEVAEVLVAGLAVKRAGAVRQQQADHGHALGRDWAGSSQVASQHGERPGRLADRRPGQRESCRTGGNNGDGGRISGGGEYPPHARGQVAAGLHRRQLHGPRRQTRCPRGWRRRQARGPAATRHKGPARGATAAAARASGAPDRPGAGHAWFAPGPPHGEYGCYQSWSSSWLPPAILAPHLLRGPARPV
jgi:hypothetical protein